MAKSAGGGGRAGRGARTVVPMRRLNSAINTSGNLRDQLRYKYTSPQRKSEVRSRADRVWKYAGEVSRAYPSQAAINATVLKTQFVRRLRGTR
jgi:hypothetical protein